MLTDAEGTTIARWSGYDTPSDFIETLAGYTADPIAITAREERFAEAPDERGGWGATLAWLKTRAD